MEDNSPPPDHPTETESIREKYRQSQPTSYHARSRQTHVMQDPLIVVCIDSLSSRFHENYEITLARHPFHHLYSIKSQLPMIPATDGYLWTLSADMPFTASPLDRVSRCPSRCRSATLVSRSAFMLLGLEKDIPQDLHPFFIPIFLFIYRSMTQVLVSSTDTRCVGRCWNTNTKGPCGQDIYPNRRKLCRQVLDARGVVTPRCRGRIGPVPFPPRCFLLPAQI
jgi:hypothetical protein